MIYKLIFILKKEILMKLVSIFSIFILIWTNNYIIKQYKVKEGGEHFKANESFNIYLNKNVNISKKKKKKIIIIIRIRIRNK